MNKEINNFIGEFETVFNGEPWYGKSLMAVVKDADTGKVFKKYNENTHSAYEILHHLYAWRDLLVRRLNGDNKASISINSKEDWSVLPAQQTAATWQTLVKKLEQNQKDLVAALSKYDDESLDKNFIQSAYSLRTYLEGQIQHDIYHLGQIALALKNAQTAYHDSKDLARTNEN